MAISAIDSSGSSGETQSALVRYQQKLAADLAAKAAEKVITADKQDVAKAQLTAQRAQQPAKPSTARSAVDPAADPSNPESPNYDPSLDLSNPNNPNSPLYNG